MAVMFKRFYVTTFLFALFALCCAFLTKAEAQQGVMRIAAVVNDDVISAHDLVHRLRWTIATGRMPNTAEVQKRLTSQMLNAMVDERLKLQEADRMGISVSEESIQSGLATFAKSKNIKPELLDEYLAKIGVDRYVLEELIEVEIAWIRVLRRDRSGRTDVLESEIDDVLAEEKENIGKPEYNYSEIFLPFNGSREETAAREMAERLLNHLKNGASFKSLARDFSQSASAAQGGQMGWVLSGAIEPQLENVLGQLPLNSMSVPVRTASGYYLLNLKDKRVSGAEEREEILSIAQAIFPIKPDAPQDMWNARLTQAKDLMHKTNSCEHLVELGQAENGVNANQVTNIKLSDLPADLKQTLSTMDKGEITTHMRKQGAVLVLMVCDRFTEEAMPEVAKRKAISQKLLSEKLAREDRRLLQKLRRDAIVDIRL
jgi:peptidyl-prolyl cis-trans isomerase SurA